MKEKHTKSKDETSICVVMLTLGTFGLVLDCSLDLRSDE